MQSYEFTGKTVKDAVAKACEGLQTDEANIEIEILEESSRGFLGIVGQRDARIRVTTKDSPQEPRSGRIEDDKFDVDTEISSYENGQLLEDDEDATHHGPSVRVVQDNPETGKLLAHGQEILEQILNKMSVQAEVVGSVTNGALYFDIQGDGSGLLIGKRGQTLDALQFLLNKIVNKNTPIQDKIEVVVDTENYRTRKRDNLKDMALKMSQKAKRTLKPVSFNPMPAYERRLIHLILAEDNEIFTKSYGEGPLRRIIVYPRKAMPNKRRRR
jgi:spoIIIJ-associated protein